MMALPSRPAHPKLLAALSGEPLTVASASEPYVHYREGGQLRVRGGTGGVVAALDPLMRAVRGTWVAAGQGEADREAADAHGRLVAPGGPETYSLRRLWLPEADREGFMGFSNGALWPLAHMIFVAPRFEEDQWRAYRSANRAFAAAVAQEAPRGSLVWINDYHLSLAGSFLRKSRPDLTLGFFWHIPWPAAQRFSICPWAEELLSGILAYDVVGFNSPYHSSHFLDSVDQLLEARIDRVASTVYVRREPTRIGGFPISIDPERIRAQVPSALATPLPALDPVRLPKKGGILAVGVDRMDYIKGIPEKLRAVDRFLQRHPSYAGRFTLVQVASPTRLHLEPYQRLQKEVRDLARDVNRRHAGWMAKPSVLLHELLEGAAPGSAWRPVVLVDDFLSREQILRLYAQANLCIVSSLHDGMNLVCKEYVAAHPKNDGALVLSKFAGASREMRGAFTANPYSVEETAEAIHSAIIQPEAERRRRMALMAREISEHDVYGWASSFLNAMGRAKLHGR